jgi:hypothetical protein
VSGGPRALAALAVVLVAGGACREADEATTPEGAVRAFARGADPRPTARDRDRVYALVGPRTRARLTEVARLASQQAGARRPLDWKEMLLVGLARPRYELKMTRMLDRAGDTARVEVRGAGGERDIVEVVREGALWKVELPTPPPDEPASGPASKPTDG